MGKFVYYTEKDIIYFLKTNKKKQQIQNNYSNGQKNVLKNIAQTLKNKAYPYSTSIDALETLKYIENNKKVKIMSKNKLAIFGGETNFKNFQQFNTMATEEINAVKSGRVWVLSKFLGEWHPDFYGGPKVREFELACEEYFNVKNAVSVNSWTSGLICSVGAIDIEPGDEVILSPWTMCACASAILHWNAIPVFADIDPYTYNLNPQSIEKNITEQTKAIMAIDIFGQSADMDEIMLIAKKHNLKVISDSAQSPGAIYKERWPEQLLTLVGTA